MCEGASSSSRLPTATNCCSHEIQPFNPLATTQLETLAEIRLRNLLDQIQAVEELLLTIREYRFKMIRGGPALVKY